MVNARDKGHAYERKIAEEFRAMGYAECVTSRSESRNWDDAGVDLCNTGAWNIQCKALERTPPYHDILSTMPSGVNINVIFHKRNRKGEVVVMSKENFYKMMKWVDSLI